jgi:nitroreductase
MAMLVELEELIRRRRTSLRVDPDRPIPSALLDRLVGVVGWAPNHKRTWPWRIAVVTDRGRDRLGELVASYEERNGSDPARVAKARTKYVRAPVVVIFGRAAHSDPTRWTEDRDAVVAGIQNFLLAATAAGLASHWATGTWMADEAVKAFAGLDPVDELVALVYLGWPIGEIRAPERPEPRVTFVDH